MQCNFIIGKREIVTRSVPFWSVAREELNEMQTKSQFKLKFNLFQSISFMFHKGTQQICCHTNFLNSILFFIHFFGFTNNMFCMF